MRWEELVSLRELGPIKDDRDFQDAIRVMEILKRVKRGRIAQAYLDFTATMCAIYEQRC